MPIGKPDWKRPSTRRVFICAAGYLLAHLADVAFTFHALSNGLGVEMNPLVAWSIGQGLTTFLTFKIGLALFSLAVLAGLSRRVRLAWIGLRGATVLYAALTAYHVVGTIYALT